MPNIGNGKAHIKCRICQQNHRIEELRNLRGITYRVPGISGSARPHSGSNYPKDGQNTNVFILTCMNRKYSSNNSYNVVIIYWVMISLLYYICHKQSRVPYIKSYSISLILQYLPIFSNFVNFHQFQHSW